MQFCSNQSESCQQLYFHFKQNIEKMKKKNSTHIFVLYKKETFSFSQKEENFGKLKLKHLLHLRWKGISFQMMILCCCQCVRVCGWFVFMYKCLLDLTNHRTTTKSLNACKCRHAFYLP